MSHLDSESSVYLKKTGVICMIMFHSAVPKILVADSCETITVKLVATTSTDASIASKELRDDVNNECAVGTQQRAPIV